MGVTPMLLDLDSDYVSCPIRGMTYIPASPETPQLDTFPGAPRGIKIPTSTRVSRRSSQTTIGQAAKSRSVSRSRPSTPVQKRQGPALKEFKFPFDDKTVNKVHAHGDFNSVLRGRCSVCSLSSCSSTSLTESTTSTITPSHYTRSTTVSRCSTEEYNIDTSRAMKLKESIIRVSRMSSERSSPSKPRFSVSPVVSRKPVKPEAPRSNSVTSRISAGGRRQSVKSTEAQRIDKATISLPLETTRRIDTRGASHWARRTDWQLQRCGNDNKPLLVAGPVPTMAPKDPPARLTRPLAPRTSLEVSPKVQSTNPKVKPDSSRKSTEVQRPNAKQETKVQPPRSVPYVSKSAPRPSSPVLRQYYSTSSLRTTVRIRDGLPERPLHPLERAISPETTESSVKLPRQRLSPRASFPAPTYSTRPPIPLATEPDTRRQTLRYPPRRAASPVPPVPTIPHRACAGFPQNPASPIPRASGFPYNSPLMPPAMLPQTAQSTSPPRDMLRSFFCDSDTESDIGPAAGGDLRRTRPASPFPFRVLESGVTLMPRRATSARQALTNKLRGLFAGFGSAEKGPLESVRCDSGVALPTTISRGGSRTTPALRLDGVRPQTNVNYENVGSSKNGQKGSARRELLKALTRRMDMMQRAMIPQRTKSNAHKVKAGDDGPPWTSHKLQSDHVGEKHGLRRFLRA